MLTWPGRFLPHLPQVSPGQGGHSGGAGRGDRGQDTFSATKSAPEPGRDGLPEWWGGSVTSGPFPARAGSFPADSSGRTGRSRRPKR